MYIISNMDSNASYNISKGLGYNHPQVWFFTLTAVYSFLLLIGITAMFLNSSAILAIFHIRGNIHSNIRLVCCLAVFDLIISIIVISEASMSIFYLVCREEYMIISRRNRINLLSTYPGYDPCLSMILHLIRYTAYNGTLLSLSAVAADLYVAIMYPLRYSRLVRPKRVSILIGILFIVSLLCASTELYLPPLNLVIGHVPPNGYVEQQHQEFLGASFRTNVTVKYSFCVARWADDTKSSLLTLGILLISIVVVSVIYIRVFNEIRHFHLPVGYYCNYQRRKWPHRKQHKLQLNPEVIISNDKSCNISNVTSKKSKVNININSSNSISYNNVINSNCNNNKNDSSGNSNRLKNYNNSNKSKTKSNKGNVLINRNSNNSMRRNQRGLATTLILLLIFLCCFLPAFLGEMYVLLYLKSGGRLKHVHVICTRLLLNLPLICSVLDPLLYSFRLKDIKKSSMKLFINCYYTKKLRKHPPIIIGRPRVPRGMPVYRSTKTNHRRSIASTSPQQPSKSQSIKAASIFQEKIRHELYVNDNVEHNETAKYDNEQYCQTPFLPSSNEIPESYITTKRHFRFGPPNAVWYPWNYISQSLRESWTGRRRLFSKSPFGAKVVNKSSSSHSTSSWHYHHRLTSYSSSFGNNNSLSYESSKTNSTRLSASSSNTGGNSKFSRSYSLDNVFLNNCQLIQLPVINAIEDRSPLSSEMTTYFEKIQE